jgi:predicted cobalt transporter CbtA
MAEERSTKNPRAVVAKAVNGAASLVRAIATLFALVLVIRIVLTLGNANPDNGIVKRIAELAEPLTLGFKDLFTPDGMKTQVLVNYGLAAVFWLVVGAVLAKVIRRFA